jgi:hypothetical protein
VGLIMFKSDYLLIDFDEKHRILHIAYRRTIHPTSEKNLDAIFSAFEEVLAEYTKSGRIYLIIDMTNIIIEPELKAAYIARARAIMDKYIFPGGIARYGFQITRITVRAGFDQYTHDNPNIFNSKEEAYEYIYSLIEKNVEMSKA